MRHTHSEDTWTVRVFLRYLFFQVPGWILTSLFMLLLNIWFDLPAWSWGIVAIAVIKDLIMFPFVWRAYDPNLPIAVFRLRGTRCIAKERLAPAGYVMIHGELWRAEIVSGGEPIEIGEQVEVVDVRGLTLIVKSL